METSAAVGLGVRFAARVIDVALMVGLNVGLGQLMGFGLDWLVVGAALIYAYFVGTTASGGTIGKRLLGLRVVGPGGGAPTLGQAAIREAFTVLGAIPFVGPILAFAMWIAIVVTVRGDAQGRGLHDRWAGGTRVELR